MAGIDIIQNKPKPSALQQALSFIKQVPNNVRSAVQENVVWPIQRAQPQYQQQLKNADTFERIRTIKQQITPQDRLNWSQPSKSTYVYHGLINNQPTAAPIVRPQVQAKPTLIPTRLPTRIPTQLPTATPTPTPPNRGITPIPRPGLNPEVQKFLHQVILPVTRKYNIPDAVAAGQFAQEGRMGGVGANMNNFFNLGITDSMVANRDYSRAPHYTTPQEGAEAYARFITGQATPSFYANGEDAAASGKIGRKQLQEIFKRFKKDPKKLLQAIAPMYSSQSAQYAFNIMNTPEYQTYYDPNYPTR